VAVVVVVVVVIVVMVVVVVVVAVVVVWLLCWFRGRRSHVSTSPPCFRASANVN
jgi:hypothetical protein